MDPVKQYHDEVRVRRALAVMDYQVTHGASIHDACAACNVPERTFYAGSSRASSPTTWPSPTKRIKGGRGQSAQRGRGRYGLHDQNAAGSTTVRGANPIAAARFVYAMAGLEPRTSPTTTFSQTNMLVGLPHPARFAIADGAPVVDEQGRLKIIDGPGRTG